MHAPESPVIVASYFSTEDNRTWNRFLARIVLDTVVQRDDVETIEQLPFVLVNTLDLNIEHRGGIDLNAVVGLEHVHESLLVFLFDNRCQILSLPFDSLEKQTDQLHALHFVNELLVVDVISQLSQLR